MPAVDRGATGRTQPTQGWPQGTPTWVKLQLQTLEAGKHLFGIPPGVLAAIEKYQSGFYYPMQGSYAVNATGYGGYFGLTAKGGQYKAPTGKMVGVTGTEARTGSLTSYRQQAEVAAAAYSGYEKWTHLTLEGALKHGTATSGVEEWNAYAGTPNLPPTSPTPSYSPGTTSTAAIRTLTGVQSGKTSNAVLAGLTRFLNPSRNTGGMLGFLTSGVANAMKMIAFRGGATILFLIVTVYGIHIILRGPNQRQGVIERYIGLGQGQARLAQANRRLDIASFDAQTRRNPPTRTSHQIRESYSTQRRLSVNIRQNMSTIRHHSTPNTKKPRGSNTKLPKGP